MTNLLPLLICLIAFAGASAKLTDTVGAPVYSKNPTLIERDDDSLVLMGTKFNDQNGILEAVYLKTITDINSKPIVLDSRDTVVRPSLNCHQTSNINHVVAGSDGHFAYVCLTKISEQKNGLTLHTFKADGEVKSFTFLEFDKVDTVLPLEIFYDDGNFYVLHSQNLTTDTENQTRLFIQGFVASSPRNTTYDDAVLIDDIPDFGLPLKVYWTPYIPHIVRFTLSSAFNTIVDFDLRAGSIAEEGFVGEAGTIYALFDNAEDYIVIYGTDSDSNLHATISSTSADIRLDIKASDANTAHFWGEEFNFAVLTDADNGLFHIYDMHGKSLGSKRLPGSTTSAPGSVSYIVQAPYYFRVIDSGDGSSSILLGKLPSIWPINEAAFLQYY